MAYLDGSPAKLNDILSKSITLHIIHKNKDEIELIEHWLHEIQQRCRGRQLPDFPLDLNFPEELLTNRDFIYRAFQISMRIYWSLPEVVQNDKEIIKMLIRTYPEGFTYLLYNHRNNYDIALFAVEERPLNIAWVGYGLRKDPDINQTAINNYGGDVHKDSYRLYNRRFGDSDSDN